ncbi:surface antigen-domain-containing protein [Kalaharituber pfeilii]|nr:surface antigen-domain-containing protein [Kalaharituber pfeilii]
MAAPLAADDDVFERLKLSAHPEVLREREAAVKERVQAQYERHQKRLAELIQNNSTLPVHIHSVHVDGAKNTRRGFLRRVFEPVLSAEKQESYTLESAMRELQKATARLHQFEIFHPNITISLDTPSPPSPLIGTPNLPTPLDVVLTVRERSRLSLKSGTEFGNTEGTGYVTLSARNLLGGADLLSVSASTGTRTRSAYDASLTNPLFSNPDLNFFAAVYANSRSNHDFASHEEVSKGGRFGISYVTPESRDRHELSYEGTWRQITNLSKDASLSIRNEAGDTTKSAIRYSFTRDWRDHPQLPSRGYLFRAVSELAGKGGLGGDVFHLRAETETQFSVPLVPSAASPSNDSPSSPSPLRTFLFNTTLITSLRTGLLYPLTSAPSRLPDRFHLGGPTSVRNFRECGMGPHDGNDALGGDIYMAGSTSLLFPIPHVGADKPIRIQTFINAGRLLAWDRDDVGKEGERAKEGGVDLAKALRQVVGHGAGWPSTTVGIGLVYAHQVARLELNFGVPVVLRAGERARKGLQFGIGVSVL